VTLLSAMAAVLLTWAVLGAALAGAGLVALRLFDERRIDADRLLMAFWLGYALAIAALQLWNFFQPITWLTEAILLAAGGAGLAWRARALRAWAGPVLRTRRGAVAALLLLGALVSNQAIGGGDATDSGLYHYQLVRWANEHPVVPGLANLSPN
jgi:hypothetical protein